MADPRRLERLARLGRVREVERQRAAGEAAASGSQHDRLHALARRSSDLAQSYAAREDALDGAGLAVLFSFRSELNDLTKRASGDAENARIMAERARLALNAAQRRRDLVDDRLEREKQAAIRQLHARNTDLARTLNKRGKTVSPSDRKAP